MSQASISRIGNTEFTDIQGTAYKRRVGTTQWVRVSSPPPSETNPLLLMLVRQRQSPGEPLHWSLFLASEGQRGDVFQVKGDAIAMNYVHTANDNLLSSESFEDSYIISRPNQQQSTRIRYWATHEHPPSAPNQAAVQENCQGWTIRVMARLIAENIVASNWGNFARGLQEPLY